MVLAVAEPTKRLAAGALEIQRCRIEERDRHLAKQLLPMAVEVLFDGILAVMRPSATSSPSPIIAR